MSSFFYTFDGEGAILTRYGVVDITSLSVRFHVPTLNTPFYTFTVSTDNRELLPRSIVKGDEYIEVVRNTFDFISSILCGSFVGRSEFGFTITVTGDLPTKKDLSSYRIATRDVECVHPTLFSLLTTESYKTLPVFSREDRYEGKSDTPFERVVQRLNTLSGALHGTTVVNDGDKPVSPLTVLTFRTIDETLEYLQKILREEGYPEERGKKIEVLDLLYGREVTFPYVEE